jgi:hypothetical protein
MLQIPALSFSAFSAKTLDTNGVLTVTNILTTVTSFSGVADIIETITPQFGSVLDGGAMIILKAAAGHTITINDAGTNIVLGADIVLVGNNDDTAVLFYDNARSKWTDFQASFASSDIPWATPGTIGSTTPSTGAFTTLTATGNLTVGDGVGSELITINGAAAANRRLQYQSAGSLRWSVGADTTAEGGSNAGSNYVAIANNDAGASLAFGLILERSTGNLFIGSTGNLPSAKLHVKGNRDETQGLFQGHSTQTSSILKAIDSSSNALFDVTTARAIVSKFLNLPPATATISGGVITATTSFMRVDTEAAAASDDLDTINGGADGDILIVNAFSSARTVVMKDATGNLALAGDFSLDNSGDRIMLHFHNSAWNEISRSDNTA